jgi:hypothetical protein
VNAVVLRPLPLPGHAALAKIDTNRAGRGANGHRHRKPGGLAAAGTGVTGIAAARWGGR